MNIVDVLAILLLAYNCFKSTKKGLILSVFDLLGIFIGLYIAYDYYLVLSAPIESFNIPEFFAHIISFCAVLFVVFIFFHFVGYFLERIIEITHLGFLNTVGGFLFGIVKSLIIIIPIIFILHELNITYYKASILHRIIAPLMIEIQPADYSFDERLIHSFS